MKKVKLTKKTDEIYIEDLKANQHIGFIDNEGYKGYLVYVGDGCRDADKGRGHLHAVSMESHPYWEMPNMSYGMLHHNRHHTPQGALKLGGKKSGSSVKEVFVFDDRKELFLWLSI